MCTAPFRLQSYAVSCLRARGYPGVTLLPPRHHCWYTEGCAAVVAKTLSIFRFSPTSVRGCGLPEGGVGRRGRRRAAPPGCRAGAAAPLPRLCPAIGGAAPAGCAVFHLSLRGGWQRELRLGVEAAVLLVAAAPTAAPPLVERATVRARKGSRRDATGSSAKIN